MIKDNSVQYTKNLIKRMISNNPDLFKYTQRRKEEEPYLDEVVEDLADYLMTVLKKDKRTPPPHHLLFNSKSIKDFIWTGISIGEFLKKQIEVDTLNRMIED